MLPSSLVEQLRREGLLWEGGMLWQSVFSPESFATVNKYAAWEIVS
jgi:hypothetical protein